MARYEPTPGWLAMKLRPCGHERALTLLAIACLDGYWEHTEEYYAALATCSDPFHEIRSAYLAASERAPWLLEAAQPLLEWVQAPDWSSEQALRRAAGVLADVDMGFVRAECGGDLLGRVHTELNAMTHRQREAIQYCDVGNINRRYEPNAWCGEQTFHPGDVIVDTAAATCVRSYTHAVHARRNGVDPAEMVWLIADFDPFVLALGAVQFSMAQPGPNVHISVVDYPADVRTAWPRWDSEAPRARFMWNTDIAETLVRLGAQMPPDQFWRGFPSIMLYGNPVFEKIVSIAHGFVDAPQDVYEAAVAHVSDPDFMLRGLVHGLRADEEEDYTEAENAIEDHDLFAMSNVPILYEDDFVGPAAQLRYRVDTGYFTKEQK